eukprot:CAMPEP_0172494188 /NCGR_PEP_ID=MMETSP1066-20121228/39670_1 /TAXON_ID=671091 /ORGANISM="Coscinodiscus wailesii, Strain CCMP2513" /LENGTH=77 /DNA_ID=CAMNT_0013264937 /DNA_START=138 /DNA_END=371 /DNA_ORIENTATION=-
MIRQYDTTTTSDTAMRHNTAILYNGDNRYNDTIRQDYMIMRYNMMVTINTTRQHDEYDGGEMTMTYQYNGNNMMAMI